MSRFRMYTEHVAKQDEQKKSSSNSAPRYNRSPKARQGVHSTFFVGPSPPPPVNGWGRAAPPPELGWEEEEKKKGERIRGGGGNGGRKNGEAKEFLGGGEEKGRMGMGQSATAGTTTYKKEKGGG